MSSEAFPALIEAGFQPGEQVTRLGMPYDVYRLVANPDAGIVLSERGAERTRQDPQYAGLLLRIGRCAVEYEAETADSLYAALEAEGLRRIRAADPDRETTESVAFRAETALGELVIKAYRSSGADLQFLVMNWIHGRLAAAKPVYSLWNRLRAGLAHRHPTGGLRFQSPEQLALISAGGSRGIIVMPHMPGYNLRDRIIELEKRHTPGRVIGQLSRISRLAYRGLHAALAPYGRALAGDIVDNMLLDDVGEPRTITLLDQPHTASGDYERADDGLAQLEADLSSGRLRP